MKTVRGHALAIALAAGARATATAGAFAGEATPTAKSPAVPADGFAIGTEAPEIVGEDLAGAPMKLSGFRGKVVVLDFWGDW